MIGGIRDGSGTTEWIGRVETGWRGTEWTEWTRLSVGQDRGRGMRGEVVALRGHLLPPHMQVGVSPVDRGKGTGRGIQTPLGGTAIHTLQLPIRILPPHRQWRKVVHAGTSTRIEKEIGRQTTARQRRTTITMGRRMGKEGIWTRPRMG